MSNKKQEVELYICATKMEWEAEFSIEVNTYDRANLDTGSQVIIPLSQVTIEIEVPDVNEKQLQAEEIRRLQERIKKEKIDSHVRVTAIEEKIQSLMAIEVQAQ